MENNDIQRLLARDLYADELALLKQNDSAEKPEGWLLSPKSVVRFICGDDKLKISRKFYGDDILIERAVVTLIGQQGLLLIGEPGTAKSWLSELLATAISGHSEFTIQGSAGTSEDHIKYAWNYGLLLSKGPCKDALISSAILQAMNGGAIARFEEVTRCAQEIQDTLISIMSERHMVIPELQETVFAQKGFNIIATANVRDRGVHEMSSALKRRFNYETVRPISSIKMESELIYNKVQSLLKDSKVAFKPSETIVELLATVFNELRNGQTADGALLQTTDSIMSTAEAVQVMHSAVLDAHYFNNATVTPEHLMRQMQGIVLKDNSDDIKQIRHYFDTVVKMRGRRKKEWDALFKAAEPLW